MTLRPIKSDDFATVHVRCAECGTELMWASCGAPGDSAIHICELNRWSPAVPCEHGEEPDYE